MSTSKERQRKMLERMYGTLYTRLPSVPLDTCFYCLSPREALDHCPPISKIPYVGTKTLGEAGISLLLVPSCNCCNTLLGDKALYTPLERMLYLYHKYVELVEKKYHNWTLAELEELKGNLKAYITNQRDTAYSYLLKLRGVEQQLCVVDSLDVSDALADCAKVVTVGFLEAESKKRRGRSKKAKLQLPTNPGVAKNATLIDFVG